MKYIFFNLLDLVLSVLDKLRNVPKRLHTAPKVVLIVIKLSRNFKKLIMNFIERGFALGRQKQSRNLLFNCREEEIKKVKKG